MSRMISIISMGYDGYIHVKIFTGWGKQFGKICTTYQRFPCINYPNLIELSTFVLQNYLFVTFVPFRTKNRLMVAFDSNKGPNLKVVKWC